MAELSGVVDGFVLPSTVRGWTRWSDETIEPVTIRFVRDDVVVAEGKPSFVRWDILDNGEFNSGFAIDVGSYEILLDVVLGRIKVLVEAESGARSVSIVWQHTRTMMLAQIVADELAHDQSTSFHVVSEFAKKLPKDDPLQAPLSRTIASLKNAASRSAGPVLTAAVERSSISLAVGTVSADGSAILGRDGQLFLKEGSNNLLGRYERSQEILQSQQELADGWVALFQRRRDSLHEAGRSFLHLIVPEKTSALSSRFPIRISAPTHCLAQIEAAIRSDDSYISVDKVIADVGAEAFHRPTDSHPSALGQFGLLRAMLRRLGLAAALDELDVAFEASKVTSGDLAERFFGVPILEASWMPGSPRLDRLSPVHQQTRASASGRTNTVTHWQCPDAPIDRTIVAFGNSVFNHGLTPFELSWWCARLFRNFHFCWMNTVDADYVAEIGADIVVAQTVERFLFTGAPHS